MYPGSTLGKKIYSRGKVNLEFKLAKYEGKSNPHHGVIIGVALPAHRPHLGQNFLSHGWGIAAATGKKLERSSSAEYGEKFDSGKVVVHLDFDAKTIGFSVNGKKLGMAFNNLEGPVVAAMSAEVECTVNMTKQKVIQSKKKAEEDSMVFAVKPKFKAKKVTPVAWKGRLKQMALLNCSFGWFQHKLKDIGPHGRTMIPKKVQPNKENEDIKDEDEKKEEEKNE
eukprot:119973-Amorphochlora_amoeboformis.AAC.1